MAGPDSFVEKTYGASSIALPGKSGVFMPPRSKVITMLPPHVRQQVERRLFENGFRDYEGLLQWVRGQGYEVSDDSL